MKQETKELIKWLKDHLSHYRNQLAAGQIKIGLVTGEEEVRKSYEAINFLNSLPEIELRLCRGGYIQDKNGTPCCEGDEVIYTNKSFPTAIRGTLVWCISSANFRIHHSMGTVMSISPSDIKKVE